MEQTSTTLPASMIAALNRASVLPMPGSHHAIVHMPDCQPLLYSQENAEAWLGAVWPDLTAEQLVVAAERLQRVVADGLQGQGADPQPAAPAETRFSFICPADLRAALEAERARMESETGLKVSAGALTRHLLWLGLARADRR